MSINFLSCSIKLYIFIVISDKLYNSIRASLKSMHTFLLFSCNEACNNFLSVYLTLLKKLFLRDASNDP